ncbi:MAG: TadE/TadG family type IV pilus assembly protein [Pseudomonadota bacterium]
MRKRQTLRDQRGVASIEFAMAFPITLLLIMGAIEFGYVLYANSILEGAVREASRRGSTGYAPCDMTREEYIFALVNQEMLTFADTERSTITQTVYNSFDDIEGEPFADLNGNGYRDGSEPFSDINGNAQYDRNLGAAGLGGAGAIVVYDLEYTLNTLFGWLTDQMGSDRTWTIGARATIRNEPAAMDGTFGAEVDDCDLE